MPGSQRKIGIVMNGVTGRMGRNQHLARSVIAIRDEGGIELPDGSRLIPDPILVGRAWRRAAEPRGRARCVTVEHRPALLFGRSM